MYIKLIMDDTLHNKKCGNKLEITLETDIMAKAGKILHS